jgi:hypothetical protein
MCKLHYISAIFKWMPPAGWVAVQALVFLCLIPAFGLVLLYGAASGVSHTFRKRYIVCCSTRVLLLLGALWHVKEQIYTDTGPVHGVCVM